VTGFYQEGDSEMPAVEGFLATGGSLAIHDAYVREQIKSIHPARVVDFGAGQGKMGRICREVLGSSVEITAVEGWEPFVPLLRESNVYDRVDHALLQDWIAGNTANFDLALFGNVLYAVKRRETFRAINRTLRFAANVIVTVHLRNLIHKQNELNPLFESRGFFTERCFDKRYQIREKHILSPSPSYRVMNAWILGQRRFHLKTFIKEKLLMYFGRTGKQALETCGFDSNLGST
jgi:hypothetical protein